MIIQRLFLACNQRQNRQRSIVFSWLLVMGLLLSACSKSHVGTDMVRPIDETGLQQLLKASQGKVILLNFWATWCEPCVEEFPDLMKIARQFQPLGVELILVSVDDPEEIDRRVIPFLEKQGVFFRTYIKDSKDDEAFINAIDVKWSGAIPATFIYDVNGALAKRFIARQNFKTFSEALQPLLSR
ncbi:MAG: TlpA family protein disulfide reductase [candidate division KSB1 bacterium]|nr:TlpA family protein disulfide reductase [candidate division KSB1 bacterium]MDZ7302934.1 TlpA family protein disulfide reductase [candidate division KSB1 bacterium]MDZ7312210.1 TlpA family protein disulfide reductase [candidate division KSB1 bacterium]